MTTAVGAALSRAMQTKLASPDAPEDLEWKVQPSAGVVSSDDTTGVVEALVSITGVFDEVDDNIVPGSYARTLAQRTPKGVWSHDWKVWCSRTEEIAELMPGDSMLPTSWKGAPWPKAAGALYVKTRYNLDTTAGREAYSNVVFFDAGPMGQQVEWSIGYVVPIGGARRDEKSRRVITDIDLFEYSPVLFGAMPLAGTLASEKRLADDALETSTVYDFSDIEAKLAGRNVTPKDEADTARLNDYWAHGPGVAKLDWGVAGDFDRCRVALGKFIKDPSVLAGHCANLHHAATGFWPGHAPTEQVPGHKEHPMSTTTGPEVVADDTQHAAPPVDDATAAGAAGDVSTADDDVEQTYEMPTDPPADYPTGEGEVEAKASGMQPCGKSIASCPHTMSDDSYPIHDAGQVSDAVSAYPRGAGKGGKTKASIRKHIVTRAKAVDGGMKKVPFVWPEKRQGKGVSIEGGVERKDYPSLPGSVEEMQDALRDALNTALMPDPDENGNVQAYLSLDGTFADHVVCTVSDYSLSPSERQTYTVPYTVDDDGSVQLGDPEEAEKVVSVQIVPSSGDSGGPAAPPTAPATVAQKMLADVGLMVKAAAKGTDRPLSFVIAARAVAQAVAELGMAPEQEPGATKPETKDLGQGGQETKSMPKSELDELLAQARAPIGS